MSDKIQVLRLVIAFSSVFLAYDTICIVTSAPRSRRREPILLAFVASRMLAMALSVLFLFLLK